MKMYFLSNCVVICLITRGTFIVVNAVNKDVKFEKFKTKDRTLILETDNSTDVYSESLFSCAGICLSDPHCCVASYSKGASTCRIDTSERCCVETEFLDGWMLIQKQSYLSAPIPCTGCIPFGSSSYFFFNDLKEWTKAKEHCECLGGKLAELETSEENDFIKNELMNRITGGDTYWLGGYNFHNDNDMEWVSQPNQSMTFSDFQQGEPNGPIDELCMMMWRGYDFKWNDYYYHRQCSYICEFMHS